MNGRRVVVLDHTGQLGGAEIALQRLLLALDGWDVQVVLFSDGPFRKALDQHGISVEVLPLPDRTSSQSRMKLTDPQVLLRSAGDSLTFARRLADRLKELGVDLVVANSLKAAVLAELSSWHSGLPWVWHLHDRLASDYLPGPVVFALRRLARRAAHIVANSQDVAQLTRLPPSRVTIAYPGLPDDAFAPGHQAPSPPVFGLLGRVSSTKGQREFIEAAAIVSRDHPDVRFRIVGEALFSDQAYATEVEKLTDERGLAGRVEWTGWARDPRSAIDAFTALVHASPVAEPFGQVIVEAMAREVPVIATIGGGVGDIVNAAPKSQLPRGAVLSTDRGRAVSAGDIVGLARAMQLVLATPSRTQRIAHHAYLEARSHFTITRTAAACSAAWSSALS